MKNMIFNYFKIMSDSNKIGHAFLIANEKLDNLICELENIISTFIIDDKVKLFSSSDIFVVKPENGIISKKQIVELQNKLTTTSQTNNFKVYIIDECEKMNLYASNSLLKILEEPQEHIIAFLITNNLNSVISTIKSRCQLIFTSSETKNDLIYTTDDDDFINIVFSFIDIIEKYETKCIAHIADISSKILEKDYLKKLLIVVQYFYRDCLNVVFEMDLEYFVNDIEKVNDVLKINDINKIIHKLQVISKNIVNLDYNLNTLLFIDNLMIELGGSND